MWRSSEAAPPAHFTLSSLRCDDGQSASPSQTDLAARTATIHLDENEVVRCIWNLSSDQLADLGGTILVENQLLPDATFRTSTTDLFLDNTCGLSVAQLDSGQQSQGGLPFPSTCTISERAPSGDERFVSLSCDDGASAVPSTVDPQTR